MAPAMPRKMPIMPPMELSVAASMRNCSRMSLPCAPDGDADADLTGALGDAHQHDVHDADAADHQRDARDRAKQDGHHIRAGRGHLGDFLLVAHGEVVLLGGHDFMALAQEIDDLAFGRG